jgi:hypothetical protein
MAESNRKNPEVKIHKIGTTSDVLTSRGGLTLFAKYLEQTQVLAFMQSVFGKLRKSKKGQPIHLIFQQLFCWLMDGTSRHLTYFDQLKRDEGYAAGLELSPKEMLSSHSVKRFFKAFSMPLIWGFQRVLKRLFLWRLQLAQPEVIVLGVDSMVMDNDEADKRDGVQPTYKKVKGFHPVQMTWNRFIVDAVFRGGSKHCHHGNTVENMVRDMVRFIRRNYRKDVPIVVVMDSGFCDQKLFRALEALNIGYVCSGKVYGDVKEFAGEIEANGVWETYKKGKQEWKYFDWDDKRKSWEKERRTILCRLDSPGPQPVFEAFRPLTVLYTNMGMGEGIDAQLQACGRRDLLTAEAVIQTAHGRGKDELVHRALKEFAFEELPFQHFAPNAAFYYTMVIAHFLYECFKEDVCSDVIPTVSYANTLRRKILDIAAKIVRTGGQTWIKFTQSAWTTLQLESLWKKCLSPPPLSGA